MRWFSSAAVGCFLIASAECSGRLSKPAPVERHQDLSTPSAGPVDGVVTYETIVDATGTASQLKAQRDFFAPRPSATNEPPRYPDSLLGLGLGVQKIVVRVVIDEHGCVAQVLPAPTPFEAIQNYESTFFAAVVYAVTDWRFTPARLRTYSHVDGGSGAPAYRVLKAEQPVRTYVDVRFTFEVREGKGIVMSH